MTLSELCLSVLLISSSTAAETVASISENTNNSLENIFGVGGIIATVVVGIITCLVTWKVTLKTIKQFKLAYSIQLFPILSNSFTQNKDLTLADLQIKYKEKALPNPCLLTLDIINTGNEALVDPPIRIRSNEKIEIIPGYFEEVPSGYESKWAFQADGSNSCMLKLEHINPKQAVKVRFFLDNFPTKDLIFECPMPNIQVQKTTNSVDSMSKSSTRINSSQKVNITLAIITAILYLSIDQLIGLIAYFLWHTNLSRFAYPSYVAYFVIGTMVIALLFNVFGIKIIDEFVVSHPRIGLILKLGIPVLSAILLYLIIFNYIRYTLPQFIIAVVVSCLLGLLIHLLTLPKKF